MSNPVPEKGPFLHRLIINILSILFGILLFWFIGFVLSDIGKWERPDFDTLEDEYIPQELSNQLDELKQSQAGLQQQIRHQQDTQSIYQTSMNSSEQTMKQFLEIHRLSIEKGIQPTEEQQRALSDSEALFLENQQKFQETNQRIGELQSSLQGIEDEISNVQRDINERREPLNDEYQRQLKRNRLISASIKLAILIPLLLLAARFVIMKRGTSYAPLYYAAFIAVLIRTLIVMHEYFPRDFFKYLILAASIITVVVMLMHLIKMAASPKRDWLLKRYKEAYRKRQCPVCSFAIEKGKMKYLPKPSRFSAQSIDDPELSQPYTCPSCGTALFEECKECKSIRHSLLPYCESCNDQIDIQA